MLKLSEAIRLGAMIRPQTMDAFFARGHSCAWGAALEATGTAYDEQLLWANDTIFRQWGWILNRMVRCPACGEVRPIISMVPHLNDLWHCWPRERIAEWVATIEPAEAPIALPVSSEAQEQEVVCV
jgi:hypothetical protein